MNSTRAELIHELVNSAIAQGLRNSEIRNRINLFTQPEERREAWDYLKLIRTRRGEDINIFTGETNLSDGFRSRTAISVKPTEPQAERGPTPFAHWPIEARGQTRERIWKAFDDLEVRFGKRPARTVVAEHLNTSESTLERAQHELGIRGWPPARAPVLKDDLR
jgi:hypothetical protein